MFHGQERLSKAQATVTALIVFWASSSVLSSSKTSSPSYRFEKRQSKQGIVLAVIDRRSKSKDSSISSKLLEAPSMVSKDFFVFGYEYYHLTQFGESRRFRYSSNCVRKPSSRTFLKAINVPRGGYSRITSPKSDDVSEPALAQRAVDKHPSASSGISDSQVTANLIKILFLTFYGSLGSLMPYLPVYYHSLGHDGLYIGLLGAVKPFTTFLVAPLWGMISDKTGRHQTILKYTFISSLLLQLCVYLRHEVWFLVISGFFAASLNAPVKSLLDNMVMKVLPPEEHSNYGRLRLWGQLGFGLGSTGVGLLLSHTCGKNFSRLPWVVRGYGVAFFFHGMLSIPALLCMQKFEQFDGGATRFSDDIQEKDEEVIANKESGWAQIWGGLNLLVHNVDAMLFFFLVLVVGVSSGVIENFAYVRMREVGGTGREMGLSRLVSSVAGVPMFWFSGPLSAKLGVDKVLVLSILSYVARFLIYAFMPTAIHGLPAEALRGVTFAAFWSIGTIYANKISPPGMSATMLMFLNSMYGGLGQSLGAVIGGKMQSKYGTITTFLYAALFDSCFALILTLYLYLRGESSFRNPRPISERSRCTADAK